jgi:hypothetical protein
VAKADALLFPAKHGGHLAPATLYRHYYKARNAAGRPDLTIHGLRHTGATLAAQMGATLAELMSRLGHSTCGGDAVSARRAGSGSADRGGAVEDRGRHVAFVGTDRGISVFASCSMLITG